MACDSLRGGLAELAIAGAVNLTIHPNKFAGLTAAKLMGSHPGSRSFADGDGYLPAEGVGAVLLKPLANAVRDGDSILAVIKAATTNHSGQSGGFGVPNPQAQTQAIEECLRRAGVEPSTIGYIESSANGSPLGDAIEFKALANVLGKHVQAHGAIPIGSVKANIGHAEAASGMAQLSKVVLQMRQRRLVPTIKPARLNPNIRFEETPFRLQQESVEWPHPVAAPGQGERAYPRRAMICSVGAGGSTGHLVLEEYVGGSRAATHEPTSGPWLLVLSARNRDRLEAQVRKLHQFLKGAPALRLMDVAYTLQTGREAMEHRAALLVASLEELLPGLERLAERLSNAATSALPARTFIGNSEESESAFREMFSGPAGDLFLRGLLERKELEKLAAYWVQGGEVRWEALYEGLGPRLVTLPTYPFERRRCWLGSAAKPEPPPRPAASAQPLPKAANGASNGFGAFLKTEVAELLGLELTELVPVKALNSFGFTSIDAVSLKSKLEQEFAVEVPISTLNAYQSLNQLEASLGPLVGPGRQSGEKLKPAEMQPVLVPSLAERYEPFPLTDIQESFYLGRKLGAPDRTGCHIYFEIERVELDIYRLNAAWNRLVRRHEMLRAIMLPNGTQRILEETPPYRFRTVDLRRRAPGEQSAFLARLREEMSHRIYEPEQWPLFEISVSLLPDRRVLHFSIDELVVDALSIELLFHEWQSAYDRPELELPSLELSFRDYVLAAKAFAGSARAQKDLAYWSDKLRQMPSGPLLPGGEPAAAEDRQPAHRCARLEGTLSAEHWAALKRRAEELSVSPTALVLCLFVEALRAPSREKAFSLILTFFNRIPIHPQVEQVLGPFTSTSVFVADASGDATLSERVRQTQRQLWADLDHNSVSGIRVLRELKRRRAIDGGIALPVVFTSMVGSRSAPQAALLKEVSFSVTQTPQVYLDHQLYEQAGGLYFSWDVVREHFAPGAIDSLFERYCRLLENAATFGGIWEGEQWQLELQPSAAAPEPQTGLPPGDAPPSPGGNGRGAPARPLSSEDRAQPFPLTEQQQAYAFGRSEHGSQTPSNVYMEFEAGDLDLARLEAAWQCVLAVHPMLRATIKGDGTQQLLAKVPTYSIRTQDFAELPESAQRTALANVEHEMTARMCPLGGWPFFELRLSRLGAGKMRLHFCMDMMLADPTSIDFAAQELFDAYAAPSSAPKAPAITFQDYLQQLRQAHQTDGDGEAAATEYWSRKFADIPPGPVFPGAQGASTGKTYRLSGTLERWDRLKQKAAELAVRPAMILLAAYAEVLWHRLGGQRFTIVMPCWQRPAVHPDIYRVVGDFTTLVWVPVRHLGGTFRERVMGCHQEVQADLAHSAASGLKALRRQLRKMNPSERSQLKFPVVFTDLSPQPAFRLPEGIRFCRSSSQTSQVHLDNISAEEGDALGFYWDIAAGSFEAGFVERMFEEYRQILTALADTEERWEQPASGDVRAAISL
jgi:acyl carrier protein